MDHLGSVLQDSATLSTFRIPNIQDAMSYYRQGPYRPAIGVPPLTPLIKKIVIVSSAIWLLQAVLYLGFRIDLAPLLGCVPGRVATGWIWQLGTYMVLHDPVSPFHLLFNMLMLWMFGGELERFWGQRAFLRFYIVCGVGAGVCIVLLGLIAGGGHLWIPTVGASGALFGLFVAFGMIFSKRVILFMFLFPMQARTMALILVGLNLFYLLSTRGSGVSHIAHLGGALTGYLYLKRAWRVGDFYRELRWKIKRRRFKMVQPEDQDDRWIH